MVLPMLACLGGEDGEDAAAGADVQHHLPTELGAVLHAGVVVGSRALVILQHVFLRGEGGAGAEEPPPGRGALAGQLARLQGNAREHTW